MEPDLVRKIEVQGMQGPLAAHLYLPSPQPISDQPHKGLIIFFPGGGFKACSLEEVDAFVRVLAVRTGCCILASAYTLADARPFPAAVEDAYAVLTWAVQHHASLSWSGTQLITAGIEAGGNLAAVSALMARDRGGPALAGQILIMPMLDPGLTTCSMRTVVETGSIHAADACAVGYRGYLPRAIDRTHPYAAPLQSSRMKGLPPALILSADDDPLRDEAEQYGAKLIAAGIKTMVKRLSPIPLDEPNARCSSVRKENALHEIAAFIAGLETASEHNPTLPLSKSPGRKKT